MAEQRKVSSNLVAGLPFMNIEAIETAPDLQKHRYGVDWKSCEQWVKELKRKRHYEQQ
jgi:hypothetical protein